MFTQAEKGYLVLTLAFLAAGSGIKAYRHAAVKLGPFQETRHETGQEPRQESRQESRHRSHQEILQENQDAQGASEAPPTGMAGPVPQGSAASLGYGAGGRDTVSDSSNRSADSLSHAADSVAASEAHRTARPYLSKPASKASNRAESKAAFTAKVDLNRAEAPELTRLPGIGAKTAQAIVEYRRTHGPYRDFRDLLRIKGIGEKKLEKLMPNLIL